MVCDICGKDYPEYDIKRVLMYKKAKNVCWRCRAKGGSQVSKAIVYSMTKRGRLGEP